MLPPGLLFFSIWFVVLDTLKCEYTFNNLYTSMTLDNSLYYVLIVYTRATKNSMFLLGSFTKDLKENMLFFVGLFKL